MRQVEQASHVFRVATDAAGQLDLGHALVPHRLVDRQFRRRRTARDQVSFPPVSACRASRIVIIRVIGSTGDG